MPTIEDLLKEIAEGAETEEEKEAAESAVELLKHLGSS